MADQVELAYAVAGAHRRGVIDALGSVQVRQYELGAATYLTATDSKAAAIATATLAGAAGKTTYITGFQVTGTGATGATVVTVTVTGTITGTMNYTIAVPAGAAVGITPLVVSFASPVPASGQNQAIAVNVPSFGLGNTNVTVSAQGFQL